MIIHGVICFLFVDLQGEVTSAATYNSALNDTNSVLYKDYSNAVKQAVSKSHLFTKSQNIHPKI